MWSDRNSVSRDIVHHTLERMFKLKGDFGVHYGSNRDERISDVMIFSKHPSVRSHALRPLWSVQYARIET
jgi:hypothetical protein